jgi:hypothetical protein
VEAVVDNPFDCFEKIFCINLDSRPERWAEARLEFSKVGIQDRVERISGVVCEDPREGCARAHMKVIEYAKILGLSNCLIFEDDVWIIPEEIDSLRKAVHEIERLDWDLFYIGGTTVGPAYQISPHLAKATAVYSTQSYAISSRIYDIVLNSWSQPKVYDIFLAKEIAPVHQCFFTIPIIAFQKTGYSDIESRIVDYRMMMTKNFTHDLVRGVDGKGGVWKLPGKRSLLSDSKALRLEDSQ